MRILSSFLTGFVFLGLTADLSAQQKKTNGLGSMSARNAAAASGLAPKPNYNAPNPFAKPAIANQTAKGNMAVRNPSTGQTQVFVPQNTASGKTIYKSPQTGQTFNSQGTAKGGQVMRGSNGTQIYIPPANTSSNTAKGANMQRFNEGKALYEKLHAQGRLPSQTQVKPQPQFQQPAIPTFDLGTFSEPTFDSGSSASNAIVLPQTYVPAPTTTIQAAPTFVETPDFAASADSENMIPFQGGSVTITNPAETRGAVKFSVDGAPVTLKQGMELRYDSQPSYVIEFTRGGGQGKARYTLSAGTDYNFSVSSSGWELTAAAAEPENEIPSFELKADKDAPTDQTVIDLLGSRADDDLQNLLRLNQFEQLNLNDSNKVDLNFAASAEIVKGSRIVIASPDTKLYDGSKPIATLKQFQSYTAKDVNGSHVLIEHQGKLAWVKKADCILGDTGGF